MHASFGDFSRLAIAEIHGGVLGKHVGPDLHAGIEAIVAQVLVFEHKIAIQFLGAHEGVGRAGHRADDHTIFHGVLGHPAFCVQPVKSLPLKSATPPLSAAVSERKK